jgi:predicted HNH restriction endonuclease
MRVTVNQYKSAIETLSIGRKRILLKMYLFGPFPSTLHLASVLGYPNVGAPNVQIGTIGRIISEFLSIVPDFTYFHNGVERPGYFAMVHRFTDFGWELNKNLKEAIKRLKWAEDTSLREFEVFETELIFDHELFAEGQLISIYVSKYERNLNARAACLRHHGYKCLGCNIDFKEMYGQEIPDIIQVHHALPMSNNKRRATDPIKDLVPLCPNCHSVVHSTKKLMSLRELQKRIQSNYIR